MQGCMYASLDFGIGSDADRSVSDTVLKHWSRTSVRHGTAWDSVQRAPQDRGGGTRGEYSTLPVQYTQYYTTTSSKINIKLKMKS